MRGDEQEKEREGEGREREQANERERGRQRGRAVGGEVGRQGQREGGSRQEVSQGAYLSQTAAPTKAPIPVMAMNSIPTKVLLYWSEHTS